MLKSSWKLLPIAAAFTLGLLALAPGGSFTPTAYASFDCGTATHVLTVDIVDDSTGSRITQPDAVINISPNPTTGTGNLSYTDNGGNDTSSTTGRIQENSACETSGNSQYDISLTSLPDPYSSCDVVDSSLSTSLAQNQTVTFHLTCQTDNITIKKDAPDDPSKDFDFTISGPGSGCDDSFTLADGDTQSYSCTASDSTYVVTEDVPTGWSLDTLTCTDTGNGSYETNVANGSVSITLQNDTDTVSCTFVDNEVTGTATPGTANSVTLQVSTTTPPCNLPVVVIATVRDASGALVSGAPVTFSAASGAFTSSSGTTQAGVVSTLYTASGNGAAVITATSGSKSGTATITTSSCATPAPTAVATSTPVPTVSTGSIQPPNTGDAGLKDAGSGSSSLYGIIAAIVAIMSTAAAGSIVVARRRS